MWPNWEIIPHVNPCINHVKFWTLDNNYSEIEKNYYKLVNRIKRILLKNQFTKWFNQSELCKMCKENIDFKITLKDIWLYKYREIKFKLLELLKLFKRNY